MVFSWWEQEIGEVDDVKGAITVDKSETMISTNRYQMLYAFLLMGYFFSLLFSALTVKMNVKF